MIKPFEERDDLSWLDVLNFTQSLLLPEIDDPTFAAIRTSSTT